MRGTTVMTGLYPPVVGSLRSFQANIDGFCYKVDGKYSVNRSTFVVSFSEALVMMTTGGRRKIPEESRLIFLNHLLA